MMVLVSVLLAGSFSLQEGTDAKALFDAMVKKVEGAKTLQLKYEAVDQRGGMKREADGRLMIGQGNRSLFEIVMHSTEGDRSYTLLCDGVSTFELETRPSGPRKREHPTVKNRAELLRAAFARVGAVGTMMAVEMPLQGGSRPESIDTLVILENFELGAKEKVDGREAQVVKCQAKIGEKKTVADLQVWIDCGTGLPLKRTVVPHRGAKPGKDKMRETYLELKFDQKISDDLFTPPPGEAEKKGHGDKDGPVDKKDRK